MSWQVYGFFHPYDSNGPLGPLPRKRWIPDGKRHKVSKAPAPKSDMSKSDYNEAQAIKYARWLAERDGITIPAGCKAKVVWSGINSATKTRTVRHWNGNKVEPAYLKRVQAVEWGREHEVYNTRKDGRRGAWLYNEFRPDLTIEIPHWDWEPAEPKEEIELDAIAA